MKNVMIAIGLISLSLFGFYTLSPVTASPKTASDYSPSLHNKAAGSIPAGSIPAGFSGDLTSPNFLAARISGLVCDLCVDGIEKELNAVPSVNSTRAFPKEGVVFMSIEETPDPVQISSVLLSQGYRVHDLRLAKGNLEEAAASPQAYAKTLWADGASEQKDLMSDPKNIQPTCEKKKGFASAYAAPFG